MINAAFKVSFNTSWQYVTTMHFMNVLQQWQSPRLVICSKLGNHQSKAGQVDTSEWWNEWKEDPSLYWSCVQSGNPRCQMVPIGFSHTALEIWKGEPATRGLLFLQTLEHEASESKVDHCMLQWAWFIRLSDLVKTCTLTICWVLLLTVHMGTV